MNFQSISQRVFLQSFYKTTEFQLILILMKDYGLEDLEQMEQVWGLYIGTSFCIKEQLWSCISA